MSHMPFDDELFSGANVLITGGLGFIGSSLARRLVALRAKVTLVDRLPDLRDLVVKTDLNINAVAQLHILEACRLHNPDVKIVFASTRQIYRRPEYLPVDERHLTNPLM